MRKTEEFYRFYQDKLMIDNVLPNKAHLKLAELEKEGKITLPAKKLLDIVLKLPEKPITFELNSEKSTVLI